jgi:hypothetical protein
VISTGAKPRGVAGVAAAFQYGVADEGRGQVVAREKRRLERQQAEQTVPQSGIVLHTVFSPRPDLGRDIMRAGNAKRSDGAENAEAEAGRVDRYDNVRPFCGDVGGGFSDAPFQLAQARQDLEKAHERQIGHREQRGAASRRHRGAAYAGERRVGAAAENRAH